MHSYPLHKPVTVACACCLRPTEFTFRSNTDQVICLPCRKHLSDPTKRDKDHVAAWSELYRSTVERASGTVNELRDELRASEEKYNALQTDHTALLSAAAEQFENTPLGALRSQIEDAVVKEAEDRRDAAYRSRDAAMRVLWRFDDKHHEMPDGKCSCGKVVDTCEVAGVLEPFTPSLYGWENNQRQRMFDGKEHGLPREHPEYMKYGDPHSRSGSD